MQTTDQPYLFPNMAQSSIKRQSITAFLLEPNRNLVFQSLDCKNSINWPRRCVIFRKQRTQSDRALIQANSKMQFESIEGYIIKGGMGNFKEI